MTQKMFHLLFLFWPPPLFLFYFKTLKASYNIRKDTFSNVRFSNENVRNVFEFSNNKRKIFPPKPQHSKSLKMSNNKKTKTFQTLSEGVQTCCQDENREFIFSWKHSTGFGYAFVLLVVPWIVVEHSWKNYEIMSLGDRSIAIKRCTWTIYFDSLIKVSEEKYIRNSDVNLENNQEPMVHENSAMRQESTSRSNLFEIIFCY